MKVKDLIKQLQSMDQESVVVSQEYDGGNHTIHEIKKVVSHKKGQKISVWDGASDTDSVSDSGTCNSPVVYIN